jgi:uncharacterized damage-inducible protein DinB
MTTDHAAIAGIQADDGTPAAELIERYRDGARLLRESVAGLSPEQLLSYPVPGKMSAQEVVCHVADCEQYCADRVKRTITMDHPLLMGADGWLYPEALGYADRDIELDLALVEATRAQMAADLERLEPEAWERVAVHSETGLVTTRQLLYHAIRHLEGHVETIHEKRRALGVG